MPFPFFEVRKYDRGTVTRGRPACVLGHGFDVDGVAERQGVYARWQWDGTRLIAQVDRLGFYGLFYCHTPSGVLISPSVLQLVAEGAQPTPNDLALSVFFRIGLFLNEDTPFRAIRALPPGGTLVWKDGRTEITGGPEVASESTISRREALDGFIDLMRQAVVRCFRSWEGQFVLPLSGGRDSRHILFQMKAHGTLPSLCVTSHSGGGSFDPEAEPARRVAKAAGVPHVLLDGGRSRQRDMVRTLVATHLCSDEHAQLIQLADYCAGTRAVLDGIGGDILSRNRGATDEAAYENCIAGDYTAVARFMIQDHCRIVGAGPADVFDPAEVERRFPEDEAVEYIAETIRKFESAPDPFTSFFFWNRTRREISLAPTAIHSDAAAVLCPYLDSDLQRFLASLPFDVTRDRRFHDDAIARAFPAFAQIPYSEQVKERPRRTAFFRRVCRAADAAFVAATWFPGRRLREVRTLLGPARNGVRKGTADLLHCYRLLIDSADPHHARRLIDVADRLAPKKIRRLRAQRFSSQPA